MLHFWELSFFPVQFSVRVAKPKEFSRNLNFLLEKKKPKDMKKLVKDMKKDKKEKKLDKNKTSWNFILEGSSMNDVCM